MVKVLEKLGCEVHYNPNQTCCGQPAYNAGFVKEAQTVVHKFLADFAHPDRYIVAPSASCIGMIRNAYNDIITDPAKRKTYYPIQKNAFEFTEFLTDVLEVDHIPGARFEAVATYHDACSALRECGIREAPRRLLSKVEGLTLVEMEGTEICCGFGGTFSVKFQAISAGMAEQKIDHATHTQAQYLISTDASCLMHLDGYIQKHRKNIQTIHIADVLASGW